MSLRVPCPGCGISLKAPEERAGKKARCHKCNTSFRLPQAAESVGSARTSAPPLPDNDDDIPMAIVISEFDSTPTPNPATPATPMPPSRIAFGSAAKPDATPMPPQSESKPKLKAKSKPAAPALPPPPPAAPPAPPAKAEPELLPLDEDEPAKGPITTADASIPTVSESDAVAADPFAFNFNTAPAKDEPKSKRRDRDRTENEDDKPRSKRREEEDRPRDRDRKGRDDDPDGDEEPSRSRYRRPGEQPASKTPLIVAGVLGLLALVALVAAVIVWTGSKEPEQTKATNPEKSGDATPPAGVPGPAAGKAEPPRNTATEPSKKEPNTPTKKDAAEPPKNDPKQSPPTEQKQSPPKDAKQSPPQNAKQPPPPTVPPAGSPLELSPKLPTFRLRQAAAKPDLAQVFTGNPLRVEAAFDKVRRVFPPRERTQDTVAVWESNPGSNGKGVRLTADVYGPVGGNRVARFDFEGDGGPVKCDVSNDATLFAAAGPDGKVNVWDASKKSKTLDGFDPYADKPDDKKAGLAAVFFAKSPQHLVTVSTAGVVHLHEIATRKTMATFTPSGSLAAGRVVVGKNVAMEDNRGSLVLAVGGTFYQIATEPPLEVVWKHDLGEVGRSLGIGIAGNPGRITYAFETDAGKGRKERAVLFCLPRGRPEIYRWLDDAGEPTGVAWAGANLCLIATARGVVWAEYDTEAKRFLILALAEVPGGKAIHATTELSHWYLLPDPDDAKSARLLELAMPPDGLIDYRNAADARQPVHVVKLDAKGLWR